METGNPDQETRRVKGRRKGGHVTNMLDFIRKGRLGKGNTAPGPEKFVVAGRVFQPTQQVWIK